MKNAVFDKLLESADLHEVIADIAYNAGMDHFSIPDSRAMMATFIQWAKEFQKLHENTDWVEHGDYIGAVDAFYRQKANG